VCRSFKTGKSGGVEREVPWRQGGRTRSATRSDLIRLLVPVSQLPLIRIRTVQFHRYKAPARCALKVQLFVMPNSKDPVVVSLNFQADADESQQRKLLLVPCEVNIRPVGAPHAITCAADLKPSQQGFPSYVYDGPL
jgi:hypothetical protein